MKIKNYQGKNCDYFELLIKSNQVGKYSSNQVETQYIASHKVFKRRTIVRIVKYIKYESIKLSKTKFCFCLIMLITG